MAIVQAPADSVGQAKRCDTCGQPCADGMRRYTDTTGHERIGCTDDRACLAAYTRLSRDERRVIERTLRWRRSR